MRDFFVFTMITKTRPWRHIYHDIEIPRPKNHDIEIPRPKNHDIKIPRPKNHDIEKRRQLTHDIVIPRRFSRDQKAMASRFQDQKPRNRDSKTKKPRYGVPVEFWPLCPLILHSRVATFRWTAKRMHESWEAKHENIWAAIINAILEKPALQIRCRILTDE